MFDYHPSLGEFSLALILAVLAALIVHPILSLLRKSWTWGSDQISKQFDNLRQLRIERLEAQCKELRECLSDKSRLVLMSASNLSGGLASAVAFLFISIVYFNVGLQVPLLYLLRSANIQIPALAKMLYGSTIDEFFGLHDFQVTTVISQFLLILAGITWARALILFRRVGELYRPEDMLRELESRLRRLKSA